ncbi:FAS-associated death domain protein-like [Takifugu rubripes]|uniref:Fas (tnfrsf6)-associated via death domain n=1 Tax=Takifugu rubripes TaxID=31033 RepID=A0A674ML73_TAKRU|nr:FAS-associated death domain protein [Takifugu rubripes]XP_029702372.1 FAS-associated death domain protein-like [Takifugu rubripes]
MDPFQFKAVLLEISNQLTEDQLSKVKFLCQDHIGKRSLETIDSGTKLFTTLSERGHLSPDDTELLGQMLQKVGRDDLFQILDAFVTGSRPGHQDDTENAKLATATEVLSEHLGRSWRRLGRRLGLSEVKLDSISRRHPTELDETAVELLKEWRKLRGPQACVEDLIQALRACDLNLTAHKLELRISDDAQVANMNI